jgi:hypothetical protein
VQLVRATSDDFFDRADALAHFGGTPVDLAFIDGMHLSEFALRDFVHTAPHMGTAGVVVFDDMLPRHRSRPPGSAAPAPGPATCTRPPRC